MMHNHLPIDPSSRRIDHSKRHVSKNMNSYINVHSKSDRDQSIRDWSIEHIVEVEEEKEEEEAERRSRRAIAKSAAVWQPLRSFALCQLSSSATVLI